MRTIMINPPKYVRLNNSALRYKSLRYKSNNGFPCYYRDAEDWEVEFRYDETLEKWFSISPDDSWLHDIELIPITEIEWRIDNDGYI